MYRRLCICILLLIYFCGLAVRGVAAFLLTTAFAALRAASENEQPARHRGPVEALPDTHVLLSTCIIAPLLRIVVTICSLTVLLSNGTNS
ncbi:hypothetical protein PF001_g22278 [Phytophthora fragariae]|uniref:Uncharacterized protein n=1 Tax=Phytophthora fragariae TaxID=53985 RepID=A0A6A4C7P5_9STRA|nr:hypothetical protein PF001_g22278 [Phytophthora fragariae]